MRTRYRINEGVPCSYSQLVETGKVCCSTDGRTNKEKIYFFLVETSGEESQGEENNEGSLMISLAILPALRQISIVPRVSLYFKTFFLSLISSGR